MAKEQAAGDIASRVEVRHLASPGATPTVADVLLSGRRVAFIFYAPTYPVQFLPEGARGLKLTSAEAEAIIAAAREKVRPLAEAEATELTKLKELGV
jgi:hypothetical protein